MRRFLVIFITSMFLISTVAIITTLVLNIVYPTTIFLSFSPESLNRNLCETYRCFPMRLLENCCVTLAIWASDGFRIWRCIILYNGISTLRRVIFLAFCFLLMFLSFAVGLVYMFLFTRTTLSLALFSSITLIINVTITTFIVARLLYHWRYIHDVLGPGHGSRYMKIVAMSIESASLIVVFNLVFIALVLIKFESNASFILLQMMVQVYVISPFLIVFRVAYNKASGSPTTGFRTQNAEEIVKIEI
ncbi:hypothetical protein GALMADRAFT_863900 [Galerina marginata CBS 339.88]|uniref:G-protein coupled receptors family 1 profile domain-containing protein n=1 Tax=Galerina marginata (strain CBS 339.88) TaxID=685588 RepID=A0A067TL25_GALM3|nr:hypothetical protein GALMADRAFT_863900 [Galerina marginata CBS 339.88]